MGAGFNQKVVKMCLKYGFNLSVQDQLEWGFSQLRIDACSWQEFEFIRNYWWKRDWAAVTRSYGDSYNGHFCGWVFLMERKAYEKYSEKMKWKMYYHDDWWKRYHEADKETRRLMDCGFRK